MIGLVRYAKCVLFGASTPDSGGWLGGGFCGGYWYWGEFGLQWWGLDLKVVSGIDGGFA